MTGDLNGAPPLPIASATKGSLPHSTCDECGKVVSGDHCYDLSGYVMNSRATTKMYQSAAATLTTEKTTTYTDVLPCAYHVCLDCARIRCAAERAVAQETWKKTANFTVGLTVLWAAITGFIALESHPVGVFLGLSDRNDWYVPLLVGLIGALIPLFAFLVATGSRRAMIFRNEPSRLWAVHSYGGLIATKMNRTNWMNQKAYGDLLAKNRRV